MYFLNGDRRYIKPTKACGNLEEQVQNCLEQIAGFNLVNKIFKLNFFVDTSTKESYLKLREYIHSRVAGLLPGKILQSVIAQPPLTCQVIVEVCYYDPTEWQIEFIGGEINGVAHFKNSNAEVLIGNVQSGSFHNCKLNAEHAFSEMITVFDKAFFPIRSIVRQWNYIENILGFDGTKQRYQDFNDVRSGVYGTAFNELGYPSATGIGMNQGGVIIEFIAIKSSDFKTIPIDNPVQVAAHRYSDQVLIGEECAIKSTPKFERARFLELFGKKLIFISGTASIVGENTIGVGDAEKQTEITIQNIRELYSQEILDNLNSGNLIPKFNHARVYIKNRKDFAVIKKVVKKHFGDLPVVYIITDICRNNLLVEMEGKVILE